jgi:hypothetical protein
MFRYVGNRRKLPPSVARVYEPGRCCRLTDGVRPVVCRCCKLPGRFGDRFNRRERSIRSPSCSSINCLNRKGCCNFDHVLEFRIRDDGDGLRQGDTEHEVQSNGSVSRQIHVIVLREIRSEVVGEQSVSVGVIRPTNVVSFVPIYFVRSSEQTPVRGDPIGLRQYPISAVSGRTLVRPGKFRFPSEINAEN